MGSLDGTHVVTVEHLRGDGEKLHPVQQAMVDFHGSQCGFCTPGFIMSLYGLWMKTPNPSNGAIEKALQGNLCRCTGYEAIMRAAHAISSYGKATKDPLAVERKNITARLKALRDGARIEIGSGKARLIVPANADDFAAVFESEPKATIVAGSTDVGLWVTKHMRDISPAIFIGGIEDMRSISEKDGVITIGAGVTYTEAFETLSKRIPALGPLVDRIGGEQVRNMGTIGGNVANGSPIGDTPPPLIALGAQLTLRKGAARRTIPLETFFIAYGKQDRQPGEFVDAVHVPVPAKRTKFAVYKVTKRRDEDITATLGAFNLSLAKDGTVADIRIAYGGMAATPKRASSVEKALLGKPWTEEMVETAMAEYARDFTPLTDMRASAEYRALAAKNLLLRFFVETTGTKAPFQVSRNEAA
jgi:xanthine dehydrogenase small subunit